MPIIKYCGVFPQRVLIGGRLFYNNRKCQQTDFGDFVTSEFVEKHIETLTNLNFVIYDDEKTEKQMRRKYENELKESGMNRTPSQRIHDRQRLSSAESEYEINQICKPYKKDKVFMDFAKDARIKLKIKLDEIKKRNEIIKTIFKCKTAVEVDKIVREHLKDWEIREAGEQRKVDIEKESAKPNVTEILKRVSECKSIKDLDLIAKECPGNTEILYAIDHRIAELNQGSSNKSVLKSSNKSVLRASNKSVLKSSNKSV